MQEAQIKQLTAELHNGTVRNLEHEYNVEPDMGNAELDQVTIDASDAARNLIAMAGFDEDDSDYFGTEMSDTVHQLLTVVMLRCPQLAARLNGTDEDVSIIAEPF